MQPMSILNAVPGARVDFSVVAAGDALMYQWFRVMMDAVVIENGEYHNYDGKTFERENFCILVKNKIILDSPTYTLHQ